MTYLSHTPSVSGRRAPLHEHLRSVGDRAAGYATVFDAENDARLAGLLHDLGKFGDLFQKRLKGEVSGIDHWSAGAWAALMEYKQDGIASALVDQGHHLGLQSAAKDSLGALDLKKLDERHPLGLRLSDPRLEILCQRMKSDGLVLPRTLDSFYEHPKTPDRKAGAMLDIRMLFSTLVDADFIETEAHFDAKTEHAKTYRSVGPTLNPERTLSILQSHLHELSEHSNASEHVRRIRSDLLDACVSQADSPTGLFTLTAPTGAGKTLSMLAFALRHALQNGLRRIVMVIPYLSIIGQTVRTYREILSPHPEFQPVEQYVLENHSLAGTRGTDDKRGKDRNDSTRLLAENWDAPIVITTSVQFLESLFANRPAACRKLHRLAKSVVLFDEVQTLPGKLIVPTLATLSHLAHRYGSSVVFSTATQPAFTHLDGCVKKMNCRGWKPAEIAPPQLSLFHRAQRTTVEWPIENESMGWDELANRIGETEQALCIVNLKRHAHELFDCVQELSPKGTFHLSTNMCPTHRQVVLDEVRGRLKSDKPCRLISTQCVEAGVDVDFPQVFRALAPLDAIAQAAGRCNRNGLAESGFVHVFIPEDERYPGGAYRQATRVTQMLLKRLGPERLNIDNPDVFEDYYRELYDLAQTGSQNQELREAIEAMDFEDVARHYRVIDNNAVNVLVPYDIAIYDTLREEVMESGLSRGWIARARPYTVGLFRPAQNDPVEDQLEPISAGRNRDADDWFIYRTKEHYHNEKGLIHESSMGCWIA